MESVDSAERALWRLVIASERPFKKLRESITRLHTPCVAKAFIHRVWQKLAKLMLGQRQRGERRRRGGAGGSSLENLHAIVVGVSHHDAPVAVDENAAIRAVELSVI